MPKATKKAAANGTLQKIEDWFLRHFGHITPGTPDHAVAMAAKSDLIATLQAPESPAGADAPES